MKHVLGFLITASHHLKALTDPAYYGSPYEAGAPYEKPFDFKKYLGLRKKMGFRV